MTMGKKPRVTVIMVNWNGRAYLEDSLSSLQEQTFDDFEIILVDNGSEDDSVDFVRRRYRDRVRLIALPENRGFAGGNNVGIKASRGEYVALLNNDTEAHREWLDRLVRCMESDRRCGMVGSKVLNFYRRDEIDNTGHLIYWDGLNRGRGRLEKDGGQFECVDEILFPSGCAALYLKRMLDETGGFDESFFAYGDDADLGLHGRCLGYKALFCPEAVVYHKYSGTAGRYSATKAFYVERNRIWVLFKYFPWSYILASPYFSVKRLIFQGCGMLTGQGAAGRFAERSTGKEILGTVLAAYWSALQGIPSVLEKRRGIAKKKRIGWQETRRLLRVHGISCREISLKD